ncbi:MAG: hypothetical protein ACR2KK_09005 [Acidimicrobiales bacterium]
MVDVDLRPERRAAVVDDLTNALLRAAPGSDVQLRGSLATGGADQFSDIDLAWIVPADRFAAAVASVQSVVAGVSPVRSLRSDPDFRRSGDRRVLFIQLANLRLFWRVDLDVHASSATGSESMASVQVPVLATEWSLAASAAANAVAAVKALMRGRPAEARGLLERGFVRVGEAFDAAESWEEAVTRLASVAAAVDPQVTAFAQDVAELAATLLGAGGADDPPG